MTIAHIHHATREWVETLAPFDAWDGLLTISYAVARCAKRNYIQLAFFCVSVMMVVSIGAATAIGAEQSTSGWNPACANCIINGVSSENLPMVSFGVAVTHLSLGRSSREFFAPLSFVIALSADALQLPAPLATLVIMPMFFCAIGLGILPRCQEVALLAARVETVLLSLIFIELIDRFVFPACATEFCIHTDNDSIVRSSSQMTVVYG